jgi:uncharacterized protein YggE
MSSAIVTGTARAYVEPDHALVDLSITHLAPTAAAALDVVAQRARTLLDLLDGLAVDRADRVTSGARVQEEHEWRDGSQLLVGHRATSSTTVTLRDLASIGMLLQRAVDDVGARIDGIAWRVEHDHPAHHRLLTEAATDARRRADAYASALGVTVSAVELISDAPIAATPDPRPAAMAEGRMMRMAAADAGRPELTVDAGRIELVATVHVRFGLV